MCSVITQMKLSVLIISHFQMFSSGIQEPEKEYKVAKAISDTIDIIDKFSGLLNFIPVNNDYLHVITGVLKTISDVIVNRFQMSKCYTNLIAPGNPQPP